MDLHAPCFENRIQAVETILTQLGIENTPRLLVFNKIDQMDSDTARVLCERYGAIGISALRPESLAPLLAAIEERVVSGKESPLAMENE